MAYSSGSQNPFFTVTPWVKRLLIANLVVFVITLALPGLVPYLAFSPARLLTQPWSPITYLFVHQGLFHLLFNLLALFFFGPPLEERWGPPAFVRFYLVAGLGGAVLSGLFALVFPSTFGYSLTVGASGAIYGVMVAFAVYWPENPIYIWGIFPVKAKWLVSFLVGLGIFSAISGSQGGVAHLAHLGGAFAAFGYLKSPWAPSAWGAVQKPTKRPRKWRVLSSSDETAAPREAVAPRKPAPTPARVREATRTLDEVDRILDKISEGGLESLTDDERRRLEEASKRFRSN